jgi:Immunity protein Imm1
LRKSTYFASRPSEGWPNPKELEHFYSKWGGGLKQSYSSKGDLRRLREWVRGTHDTPLPVGLFIPFETAWKAVKEFIETDGRLPTSIEWIANRDLPPNTFRDESKTLGELERAASTPKRGYNARPRRAYLEASTEFCLARFGRGRTILGRPKSARIFSRDVNITSYTNRSRSEATTCCLAAPIACSSCLRRSAMSSLSNRSLSFVGLTVRARGTRLRLRDRTSGPQSCRPRLSLSKPVN